MSTLSTVGKPEPIGRGERAPRKSTYRPEIQGLRSLAVLMVVTYHIWFGRVSGGVDVFLLISAFLMTMQFVGRYERQEPLALLKHWLHLFRRLLPVAVTVIVATLAASYVFLPREAWLPMIQHGWASLFYSENWLLQQQTVDYYSGDHSLASPLQHFWSLSIQGQVFILWPLIFGAAALAAKRFRLGYRSLLTGVFLVVFLGSLAYSVYFTAADQVHAYFDTGARLWEFALGTLVALLLPGLRIARPLRVLMGWVGLVAMVACGILLDVQAAFPGVAALWPTVAAALIIAAGQTGSAVGVDRLLCAKPLVNLGGISYALYLWHWPLLVIGLTWSGKEHAGWLSGSVIIVASLMLAYITTRMIEKPWRDWRWPETNRWRALVSVALVCAVAAVPLGAWEYQIRHASSISSIGLDDPRYPGALAMGGEYAFSAGGKIEPVPKPEVISAEWPVFPEPCINLGEDESICTNGIEDGVKHIVVLGSSHAFVLNTPVFMMAEKHGWQVTSITKGYCPLTDELGPGITEDCLEFNRETKRKVLDMRPDLIVTTSTRTMHDPDVPDVLEESWVREATWFNDAGIPVLGVRDTPRMPLDVPTCLRENPKNPQVCDGRVEGNFSPIPPTDSVDAELPETRFLDFTRYFCSGDVCPAIIGNVVVYKDSDHVTRSYLMTLAPFFEAEFLTTMGWS